MAGNRSYRRFGRAAAAVCAGAVLVAGCTSSDSAPPTSPPLPSGASAAPFYCGFLSKDSVQTALGTDHLLPWGAPTYFVGEEKNLDGGRLGQAGCTINDKSDIDLGVEVIPVDTRPDLVQQLVDASAAGKGSYHFASGYGVGYAGRDYPAAATGADQQGASAVLLRGNWYVSVGIQTPGRGRDPVKDVVALARQVIAFLHLPAAHAQPYPTPTASGP